MSSLTEMNCQTLKSNALNSTLVIGYGKCPNRLHLIVMQPSAPTTKYPSLKICKRRLRMPARSSAE